MCLSGVVVLGVVCCVGVCCVGVVVFGVVTSTNGVVFFINDVVGCCGIDIIVVVDCSSDNVEWKFVVVDDVVNAGMFVVVVVGSKVL